MVEGRRFELGKNEVILGSGAARAFSGLKTGESLRAGQNTWQVVGVFSAEGGIAESEIWTDVSMLLPACKRGDTFQSVYAKLNSPGFLFPAIRAVRLPIGAALRET